MRCAVKRGLCFWCSKGTSRITRDHVIPVSFGGGNHITNIVSACERCNGERGRVSDAIRMGTVCNIPELYAKWVAIETETLGHSPTASLLDRVKEITPRQNKGIRKERKPVSGQEPHSLAGTSWKMRKCCRTVRGTFHPHLPECRTLQPAKPKGTPTAQNPLGTKSDRAKLYALERMRWQDDGGQNMDQGEAIGPRLGLPEENLEMIANGVWFGATFTPRKEAA